MQYGYNEAGNPIQMIDDAEGLKITTNTVYEGNNVIQDTDPNDADTGKATESYQYDKDGNVTAVKTTTAPKRISTTKQ